MLAEHPDLVGDGSPAGTAARHADVGEPVGCSEGQWGLLAAAVHTHRPERVLLMYADALVPALARGSFLEGTPGLWSIHFRLPVAQPGARARERLPGRRQAVSAEPDVPPGQTCALRSRWTPRSLSTLDAAAIVASRTPCRRPC